MINFNSPNKKTGDNFENDVVLHLQENNCTDIQTNITIKDLGIEVDISYKENEKLVFAECKGGKSGAERTDNVKKALASTPLIKKNILIQNVFRFSQNNLRKILAVIKC